MKPVPALLVAAALGIGQLLAAPPSDECPVHHIKMTATALRVVYGMPSRAEFQDAKVAKARFPFGRDYVLGGCIVRPEKTRDGFVCPECVKARAAWLKQHAD